MVSNIFLEYENEPGPVTPVTPFEKDFKLLKNKLVSLFHKAPAVSYFRWPMTSNQYHDLTMQLVEHNDVHLHLKRASLSVTSHPLWGPLTPLSYQDSWHAKMCHSSPRQVFPLWSRCECCWLWWKVCASCGCLRGASRGHQVSDGEHWSQLHTQGQVKLKRQHWLVWFILMHWNRLLFHTAVHTYRLSMIGLVLMLTGGETRLCRKL